MFLKDHLKDTYQKASFDKNHLMLENIINRWAHRFGPETLNELFVKNQDQFKIIEREQAEENQSQINLELIEEDQAEKNQSQINLELIEEDQLEKNQSQINLELIEEDQAEKNQSQINLELIEEDQAEKNQSQINLELIEEDQLEENQSQINLELIEEDQAEKNQSQINLELLENVQYEEEIDFKSKETKKSNNIEIFEKNTYGPYKNNSEYNNKEELPLPNINNLRKWINKEKKAS